MVDVPPWLLAMSDHMGAMPYSIGNVFVQGIHDGVWTVIIRSTARRQGVSRYTLIMPDSSVDLDTPEQLKHALITYLRR